MPQWHWADGILNRVYEGILAMQRIQASEEDMIRPLPEALYNTKAPSQTAPYCHSRSDRAGRLSEEWNGLPRSEAASRLCMFIPTVMPTEDEYLMSESMGSRQVDMTTDSRSFSQPTSLSQILCFERDKRRG